MPRMKAPEGCEYYGKAIYCRFEQALIYVLRATDGKQLLCLANAKYYFPVPVDAVLTAIRNAGLDPVYEATRRAVEHWRDGETPESHNVLTELSKLFDSLEEPNDPH